MRTTLDIDIDVLEAVRDIAQRERSTAGVAISRLARAALTTAPAPGPAQESAAFYGFRPLPRRGGLVTNDLINRLRDDRVD
jgi:hypothetical protein